MLDERSLFPPAFRYLISMWHVYLLELVDGRIYTGLTSTTPDERWLRHRSGRGGQFTAKHPPRRLIWSEPHENKSTALRREAQLKRWSHAKKSALAAGSVAALKVLSRGGNRS
jgi:predicted GIY-YIG superfamily endonuclease